jgi:hypothetical protein
MKNEAKEFPPLKEALSEVFDELTKAPEEEVVEEVASEEEGEEVVEEAAADEVIEPLKADSDEEDAEPPDAEKDEEDLEDDDIINPLQHWRPDDKEMFKTLPKEAQEFLIDRDKRFQRSVTQKQGEVAEIRRAMDPIRDELVKHGVSEGDAVRRLIGAHMRLKDDPANTILELMSSYDIDIKALMGEDGDGEKTGPSDSAARREVRELKEEVQRDRETRQAQDGQKLASEIEVFKKDHEFFDDVREEMTAIAWSYHNRKLDPPPLADLYEKACWQDESIRKKMIAQEGSSKSKKDSEDAKKAKKASSSKIRSAPKSASEHKKEKKTLREDLSDNYDMAHAR